MQALTSMKVEGGRSGDVLPFWDSNSLHAVHTLPTHPTLRSHRTAASHRKPPRAVQTTSFLRQADMLLAQQNTPAPQQQRGG